MNCNIDDDAHEISMYISGFFSLLISSRIEPNHAAGVKLIFLILTVASAGILFYYVTAALKMSKRKPYG